MHRKVLSQRLPLVMAVEHQPAFADAAPNGDSSDSMTAGEDTEVLPSLD